MHAHKVASFLAVTLATTTVIASPIGPEGSPPPLELTGIPPPPPPEPPKSSAVGDPLVPPTTKPEPAPSTAIGDPPIPPANDPKTEPKPNDPKTSTELPTTTIIVTSSTPAAETTAGQIEWPLTNFNTSVAATSATTSSTTTKKPHHPWHPKHPHPHPHHGWDDEHHHPKPPPVTHTITETVTTIITHGGHHYGGKPTTESLTITQTRSEVEYPPAPTDEYPGKPGCGKPGEGPGKAPPSVPASPTGAKPPGVPGGANGPPYAITSKPVSPGAGTPVSPGAGEGEGGDTCEVNSVLVVTVTKTVTKTHTVAGDECPKPTKY